MLPVPGPLVASLFVAQDLWFLHFIFHFLAQNNKTDGKKLAWYGRRVWRTGPLSFAWCCGRSWQENIRRRGMMSCGRSINITSWRIPTHYIQLSESIKSNMDKKHVHSYLLQKLCLNNYLSAWSTFLGFSSSSLFLSSHKVLSYRYFHFL